VNEHDYPVSGHGWSSDFRRFVETPAPYIRQSLIDFLQVVSPEQVQAWDESIPPLQSEVCEVVVRRPNSAAYTAILEYQLPMESRRPDVILLASGAVLVLELKSKNRPALADADQASAYARDLRAYHRACEGRNVVPVLMLMRARGRLGELAGVSVIGPDVLNEVLDEVPAEDGQPTVEARVFLDPEAYRPLPTIVEAARELMETGDLRRVKRAYAATQRTLDYLVGVAHLAARTRTRHLILLSGLPGTGKTLVGLQLAHARFLDDLAVVRAGGKPTAPAVYLSGNGPLVQVLQYELRAGGGGGATFVRPVKAYVERYAARPNLVPPEHVLIFDEAQRAFDAAQVAETHGGRGDGRSEPEHFIEFAERVPEWCVVVGLIGSGQEIHVGEEAGIGQWRDAVLHAPTPGAWTVHAPPHLASAFEGVTSLLTEPVLHLTAELRYHLANAVHAFVQGLLDEVPDSPVGLADQLEASGFHMRITRDLERAKRYLRERYGSDPQARFGIIASSRDSDLARFGVPNDFQSTKQVSPGPWYAEGDDDPRGRSCRRLISCVTEFGCQGLELDAVLLAWGTDFMRDGDAWTNRLAKRYQKPGLIHDSFQLRRNAYRVLLTRSRDAMVVFVPPIPLLDETFSYLVTAGFRDLEADQPE
jgi:hypothetical protein